MHTVYKLWVSSLSFKLLAEVNGPAEDDDSRIMRMNSCVAFGCTNGSRSGVYFHKVLCNKERQRLRQSVGRAVPPRHRSGTGSRASPKGRRKQRWINFSLSGSPPHPLWTTNC